MFLEPFGLLPVLPLPEWLKLFIPAYKSTRTIAEVAIESLPQCILQSYILIAVLHRVNSGIQTEADLLFYDNIETLPQSILISTVALVC